MHHASRLLSGHCSIAHVVLAIRGVRMGAIIASSFLHDMFMNLASPIWASWMADILPKDSLSRQWAKRQRFTTLWSTVATVGMAIFS